MAIPEDTTGVTTATSVRPLAGLPQIHAYRPNHDRQKVRHLVSTFLLDPINAANKAALLSGLINYELIHRFRDL